MLDSLTLLLSASLLSPGVIAQPRLTSLEHGTPEYHCYASELRHQAPASLLGEGEIYVMGPNIRRDVAPPGSVIEIVAAAPNAGAHPKFLNLSIWFETHDNSAWDVKYHQSGLVEYRASGVLSPAKVFERVRYRYLFDFDLRPCIEL
jgi:hypothetical protein